MPDRTSIVRSRRARRKDALQARRTRGLMGGIGLGIILSIVTALLILFGALTYADLTRDLPNVALLPALLNPPDGLLLHPTRVYDRTGTHLLFEFGPASSGDVRRYIPISAAAPQHLPDLLVKSTVVLAEPGFWTSGGYTLSGLTDPAAHPTVAQKLASGLLLYSEPPSLRRALRERILAAQLIAQYGRSQVLEWYLNSADYGNDAYGVDAAARLYFASPATDLTTGESAVLAAASQAPDLNPLDAPDMARERGRAAVGLLKTFKLVSADDAAAALSSIPASRPAPGDRQTGSLPLFRSLLLRQLGAQYTEQRVRRGGLVVITTLDDDLQRAVTRRVQSQVSGIGVPGGSLSVPGSASVNGQSLGATPSAAGPSYGAGGIVSLDPASAPGVLTASAGPSASVIVLDPRSGEILAAVGETLGGRETSLLSPHDPGTLLTPFTYLTAFTRGFSPGSLVWDIPSADSSLPAGDASAASAFHGPVRMRIALANDYVGAVNSIAAQMGADAISRTRQSFGLSVRNGQATLLELASAYAVFAADGVRYGAPLPPQDAEASGATLGPTAALRVEGLDHSLWLDLSSPQAQPVVTPALAYLVNSALSDEAARWPSLGHPNELEIGQPVGVKLGRSADASDTWGIAYTPARLVAAWQGSAPESQHTAGPAGSGRPPSTALLASILQLATQGQPAGSWSMPQGVTSMQVCDPSGLLPTRDCPTTVSEVFLSGNEPAQPDTLFRRFTVNRETGLLATVFTPPGLVEDNVFMVVPPEAQEWARAAQLAAAPTSYDAIQAPPVDPNVHISTPAIFSEVSGKVQFRGTASGADFDHYRLLVGQGLNPQSWIVVTDSASRIEDGLLGTWDATGLSGLYAVELQVLRTDQRLDTAITQLTVK